jgi:prepilin-type N-terminal cleavage/methylation domain-containing protein
VTFFGQLKTFSDGDRNGRAGFSLVELLISVVLILILSMMMLGRGVWSDDRRELANCQKNLQNIYLALSIYSADHKGSFPAVKDAETSEEPLSLLVPRSTTVTEMFICPGANDNKLPEGESFAKRRISYAYYMGRAKSDGAGMLLVSDRQVNTFPKINRQLIFSDTGKPPGANHSKAGGNLLYCDGEIKSTKPRASRDFLFPTNVVLLNPKP